MRIKRIVKQSFRSIFNKIQRRKLLNKDFSLISSNCVGACILHDLGLRFNSPFVNLWMKPSDFLRFLDNMDYYLTCNMLFIEEPGIKYPIGVLDDIKIYFQHYSSPDEALRKWEERSKRINKENLFILFTDRDGCTYEDLRHFDSLPFTNKVVFTHIPYKEIRSSFYVKGWENSESVGHCMNYVSNFSIKKHYDEFDYVSWFNGSM